MVRLRVGGLKRAPLGSGEGVILRLRGLGRASLWGEAGSGERESGELGAKALLRLS